MKNNYDDPEFFDRYLELRENPYSGNRVCEIPVMLEMLPDVEGKRVLDLGCGCGSNCRRFAELGARQVVGLDVSERMLEVAKRENGLPNVMYVHATMDELSEFCNELSEFDVIASSLAMHYVVNYDELVGACYEMLAPGGTLLFSQEHPVFTAPKGNAQWVAEGDGTVRGLVVQDYLSPGPRQVSWLVDSFEKYHRPLSSVINPLLQAGFELAEIREPEIDAAYAEKDIRLSRCLQVPDYLFVKAVKPGQETGRQGKEGSMALVRITTHPEDDYAAAVVLGYSQLLNNLVAANPEEYRWVGRKIVVNDHNGAYRWANLLKLVALCLGDGCEVKARREYGDEWVPIESWDDMEPLTRAAVWEGKESKEEGRVDG